MAYKLMAVDIDGTLLDSNGVLTEATKNAIRKGVENGLTFAISTGRPVQGVAKLLETIGLDLPVIAYNGAMVVTGQSNKILYEQSLPAEDTKEVIELAKKYGTTVIIWAENKLYATELNERVNYYKSITTVDPIIVKDFDEVIKNGVTKVLWYDEAEKIENWQKEVGQYLSSNINYHTSRPIFLEFVDKRASKAIAMEKLGEYYGIKQSEMIAVGDGYNDLSMIEYAGLGVAMGNSVEEIKKRSDFVTLSNDEDGVAHVINKFVLNL